MRRSSRSKIDSLPIGAVARRDPIEHHGDAADRVPSRDARNGDGIGRGADCPGCDGHTAGRSVGGGPRSRALCVRATRQSNRRERCGQGKNKQARFQQGEPERRHRAGGGQHQIDLTLKSQWRIYRERNDGDPLEKTQFQSPSQRKNESSYVSLARSYLGKSALRRAATLIFVSIFIAPQPLCQPLFCE
jgi:hypothetical protein